MSMHGCRLESSRAGRANSDTGVAGVMPLGLAATTSFSPFGGETLTRFAHQSFSKDDAVESEKNIRLGKRRLKMLHDNNGYGSPTESPSLQRHRRIDPGSTTTDRQRLSGSFSDWKMLVHWVRAQLVPLIFMSLFSGNLHPSLQGLRTRAKWTRFRTESYL